MATKKKTAISRPSTIHVGDGVRIIFGRKNLNGTVVEYRGAIGVNGRKLYRIAVPMGTAEPMSLELPANEIQVYHRATKTGKASHGAKASGGQLSRISTGKKLKTAVGKERRGRKTQAQ